MHVLIQQVFEKNYVDYNGAIKNTHKILYSSFIPAMRVMKDLEKIDESALL